MRLTVIGTGYLGAVHAACMADVGHDVLGVDTDTRKIEELAAGRAPFFEPGLPEILTRNTRAGRLRFTTSLQEAADFADLHFVCVGTPQLASSMGADVSHVDAAIGSLAPHLTRLSYVIGKSTVPVGTAARLAEHLTTHAPAGDDAELVWNPEFLREGSAVHDFLNPDRVVIGAEDQGAAIRVAGLYLGLAAPLQVTDPASAETIKYASNAFLATKISFVNAIANLCEAVGADVRQVALGMGYDPRIGF